MSSHRLNSINSLSAPLSVWWDVTSKCNLSCLHCYSRSSQAKSNEDELSNSEAKALIRELSAMKVFGLYFLGGEPFMRPDFLDLLEYSVDRQLGVTISSNGWLITNSVARKLKSIGVSQVRISIDGATPETHDWQRNTAGSFHKAVEAVGNLIKNGIESVSIVSTISRGNASETAELIDLAAKLKVQAHQILVVTQSGRGKDNYDELRVTDEQALIISRILNEKRDQYRNKLLVYSNDGLLPGPCNECIVKGSVRPDFVGCQAGRTRCNIDYNGNVIPCLLVRQPIAGNVRQQSFNNIWNHSPVFKKWRKQHLNHPECQVCELNDVCMRECPLSDTQSRATSQMRKAGIECLSGSWGANASPCLIGEDCGRK